jgi:YbbR domain-containing protein
VSRNKSETIGALGRTAARRGNEKTRSSTPPLPPVDPKPQRGAVGSWVHGAFLDNLGLKFLSMVLAVTVFLLVNTDKDRQITVHVGVSYILPDDRVLVSDRLDTVSIEIKGPWRKLRRFDEHQLDRISLDLRHTPTGELAITSDMIKLPSGLAVTAITPRTMRVQFDKRVEKLVEVAPVVSTPPHGYIVAEIKSNPATVKLRGAETVLAAMVSVPTDEISLDAKTDTFTAETEVVPPKGVELESSQKVSVQIHIDQKLIVKNLPGIVVGGVDPAKWTITPAQVDVTLTGAMLAVENAQAAALPVVKLLPADAKTHEAIVVIDGLPPGIGVKISPERVRLTPVATTKPPTP